ncbi:hypothetical protein Nepgr_013291 [Nepenthes gracilis]|uniref:Uncharacterized protein n=1 Tax=Nepenthes gracilis TaxID=150966 RepID=A0AAD3SH65_NEPGR|nr:hypothetical protein Nepgr_013291 [Nepenthes gracilis]
MNRSRHMMRGKGRTQITVNATGSRREQITTAAERDNRVKEKELAVATTRRLPSDSGAFADWVASSSSDKISINDLSLGFNAGPTTDAAGPTAASSMWPTSSRPLGYGLPPEMSMFVVAPANSFHHSNQHDHLISDSVNGPSASATALGVGVIPLLTATPCLNVGGGSFDDGGDVIENRRGGAIQFWQGQQGQQTNSLKKGINLYHNSVNLLNLSGGSGGGGGGGGGGAPGVGVGCSGGTTTCQDCGNQAKKDCSHRRCRACCRSRGFACQTHVRSTWVPAAKRRERQMMAAAAGTGGGTSSGSTSGVKKPRLVGSQNTATSHNSTSSTTPRSFDTSSSHQDATFKESLPGQVRAPAVFKCVRVTAVDDGEDEYAYQAIVKIGGHVFKGFLYDSGLESRDGIPNISGLHLGGNSGGVSGGRNNGASSSSPLLDPPDFYAASGGGLLGDSEYAIATIIGAAAVDFLGYTVVSMSPSFIAREERALHEVLFSFHLT